MSQNDQEVGASLWESASLAVANVQSFTRPPSGSVQMLGFADLHIFIGGHPFMILPRVSIKLIRGRLHFDPQAIQGTGEKAGEFFPTWRPSTAIARTVLTELLALCPEIQELINSGQQQGQVNARR